jgi:hypothetical protein
MIRLKCIYNFLCSMLVYTPFALCFVTLRGGFYAFSRNNLLTRCHSASPLFLLFLYFRKATQEIFSELDETKAKVHIFPGASWSPKQRRRGASVVTQHTTACCSIQVVDITLVKYQFINITSLRVVQQKHSGLYSNTEYYKP